MINECPDHRMHEERIRRTEEDVQRLFDKFGTAVGLMYKVDKRLEGLYGKIAGIAAAITVFIVIVEKFFIK